MELVKDASELGPLQVGVGMYLDAARKGDPEYVRQCEAGLLQGLEDRRRFEQWRLNVRLRLDFRACEETDWGREFRGFTRTETSEGTRLEVYAKLRPEKAHDGCNIGDEDRCLRWWPGPGCQDWLKTQPVSCLPPSTQAPTEKVEPLPLAG